MAAAKGERERGAAGRAEIERVRLMLMFGDAFINASNCVLPFSINIHIFLIFTIVLSFSNHLFIRMAFNLFNPNIRIKLFSFLIYYQLLSYTLGLAKLLYIIIIIIIIILNIFSSREQTRVILTSAAYIHLKQGDISKHIKNLSPASWTIVLSGLVEQYHQMLVKFLAHYFEVKLLLLDLTDFSLKRSFGGK